MNYILVINTLIAAVRAVEQLMPDSTGKEKFEAAVTMVEGVVGTITPMIPALSAVATALVTGFRAAGVFAKKA